METPLRDAINFVLFIILLAAVSFASATSYQAEGDGVKVTIHTKEQCALPAVSNLPYRALWVEKGKTYEGCAGVSSMGIVMAYFSDKTVAAIPLSEFVKVTEA